MVQVEELVVTVDWMQLKPKYTALVAGQEGKTLLKRRERSKKLQVRSLEVFVSGGHTCVLRTNCN